MSKNLHPNSKKIISKKVEEPTFFDTLCIDSHPSSKELRKECKIYSITLNESLKNQKVYERILNLSKHLFDD